MASFNTQLSRPLLPSSPSLLLLPPELVALVLSLLPSSSLGSVALTSRLLHSLATLPSLWRKTSLPHLPPSLLPRVLALPRLSLLNGLHLSDLKPGEEGVTAGQLLDIFSSLASLTSLHQLSLLHCDLSLLPMELVARVCSNTTQLFLQHQVILTPGQLSCFLERVSERQSRLELLSVYQEDFSSLAPSLVARGIASLKGARLGSHCTFTQNQTGELLRLLSCSSCPLTDFSSFSPSPLLLAPAPLALALCSLHSATLTAQLSQEQILHLFTLLATGGRGVHLARFVLLAPDMGQRLLSLTPPCILGRALSNLQEATLPYLHFSTCQVEAVLGVCGTESSRLKVLDLGEDARLDTLPLEVLRPASRKLEPGRFKCRVQTRVLEIYEATITQLRAELREKHDHQVVLRKEQRYLQKEARQVKRETALLARKQRLLHSIIGRGANYQRRVCGGVVKLSFARQRKEKTSSLTRYVSRCGARADRVSVYLVKPSQPKPT